MSIKVIEAKVVEQQGRESLLLLVKDGRRVSEWWAFAIAQKFLLYEPRLTARFTAKPQTMKRHTISMDIRLQRPGAEPMVVEGLIQDAGVVEIVKRWSEQVRRGGGVEPGPFPLEAA